MAKESLIKKKNIFSGPMSEQNKKRSFQNVDMEQMKAEEEDDECNFVIVLRKLNHILR